MTTLSGQSGPDPPGDAYWVAPGKLLAGPYPGDLSYDGALLKLGALLDVGITCFVDLTEEGAGPPLHPYAGLLGRLAVERRVAVTYRRMSIRDVDIPIKAHMRAIIDVIRRGLEDGQIVYLHCWGGVGRTGTVVGCLLVEDGVAPAEMLAHIAALRVGTYARIESHRKHRSSVGL